MSAETFTDENDIEKNVTANNQNGDEMTTFSLDDDDECVIEDVDDDDSDEDSIEHRQSIRKMFKNAENKDGDDDGNYNIHDQLPSVEEVKASSAYLPTMRLLAKGHRRKLLLTVGAAALVAVVLSVIISVGVFHHENHQKSKSAQPADISKLPGAQVHHVAHADTVLENAIAERYEATVDFVFQHHVSTLPSLRSDKSPEMRAVQFLAGGDAYNATMGDFFSDDGRKYLERYVLALFYYQTSGTSWEDQYNFLNPIDHCDWNHKYTTPQGTFIKGVQCDSRGFVVDIDLSNNNVEAKTIPYEINYLEGLQKLHLFGNPLSGFFPDVLKLKYLNSLGLMNTNIQGTIPHSIGDMTTLTTLAIGHTRLSDTIPASIASCRNLRILGLDGLGLTGNINSLLSLTELEALYLEDNQLSGSIHSNQWKKIKELDLSNNILSGSIPDQLMQSDTLQVLDVHDNNLFGYFPKEIFGDDKLEYFAIQGNRFMGTISDRIGYFKNIKHFDVSKNLLTGTLPDTMGLLTHLVSLNTAGNTFSRQPMGPWMSALTNLQDLSMKGNHLTGMLPDFFATMPSLKLLDLDGNELKGTISTFMGILPNLQTIMLNRNFLSGTIPSELAKLTKLKILLLDGNNFNGRTDEICRADIMFHHFISDCYPSMNLETGPEVDCRCCTMCCNDSLPDCNNKDWTSSYDPSFRYGYIRPAYDYSLDQAPEGWQKTAVESAVAQPASSSETAKPPV